MTDMIQQIEQAAREAGEIIRSAHGSDLQIENKEGRVNFVTVYDKRVQEFLVERLRGIVPDAGFLGEENGLDLFRPGDEEGWLFVIDPIDGTTNFIHNMHPYVTSIGLMKDGVPYAGVVYAPVTDQMFCARRGQGAYENGQRIHSSTAPLSDSLPRLSSAFNGSASLYTQNRYRCQAAFRIFRRRLMPAAAFIRNNGAAASRFTGVRLLHIRPRSGIPRRSFSCPPQRQAA